MPDLNYVSMDHVARSTMLDLCRILVKSEGAADAHGNPTVAYTADNEETRCGLRQLSTRESVGSGDVPLADYELRLPLQTTVDKFDRIRIERRHGRSIASFDCNIVGEINEGPSGLLLRLKVIRDGT